MYEIDTRLFNADGSINHEVARMLARKARSDAIAEHKLAIRQAARIAIGALRSTLISPRLSIQRGEIPSRKS